MIPTSYERGSGIVIVPSLFVIRSNLAELICEIQNNIILTKLSSSAGILINFRYFLSPIT
jgi:hypothetical protein